MKIIFIALLPGILALTQNCIIGGGPAGIQLATLMQSNGEDYQLFERSSGPGSFFSQHPIHGTLLSINKKHVFAFGGQNKEYNLRHDWNSLLDHPDGLIFTNYSESFFPDRDDLLRYFQEFAAHLKHVRYDTTIDSISPVADVYHLMPVDVVCSRVYIGTGLSIPSVPDVVTRADKGTDTEILGYEDLERVPRKDRFLNKTVAIIGMRNSAFEVATALRDLTQRVVILGNYEPNVAFLSHYVGDVRAINLQPFDTYQLKTIDSIVSVNLDAVQFTACHDNKQLCLRRRSDGDVGAMGNTGFDVIVRCTGWRFDFSILPEKARETGVKFPAMNADFSSPHLPNVYYIGELMHKKDYRKSAGGFIHGFRYLVRALWRIKQPKFPDVERFRSLVDPNLVEHIMMRISEASGLYQMYGVLADVYSVQPDGTVLFAAEIPESWTRSAAFHLRVLFKFGENYKGDQVIGPHRVRTTNPGYGHCSGLLHPAFRFSAHGVVIEQFELLENVNAEWGSPRDREMLTKFLNHVNMRALNNDLERVAPMPDCEAHFAKKRENRRNAKYKVVKIHDESYGLVKDNDEL